MDSISSWGNTLLEQVDPEIHDLIEKEKHRQCRGIELIVSENFTFSVIEALGSALTNKDSEGMPDNRYYSGNEYIDQIENLFRSHALDCFHLDDTKWGVNVQTYSGSPANFAAYTAVLNPHDSLGTRLKFQSVSSKGGEQGYKKGRRARAALHSDRKDRLNADNKLTVNNYQTELAKRLDCLCRTVLASMPRPDEHL